MEAEMAADESDSQPLAAETEQGTHDEAERDAEPQHTEPKTEAPKAEPKASVLADLYEERKRRKELSAEVDKLRSELATAGGVAEKAAKLEQKLARLESFLQASGTPLAKALDSRKLTAQLYESDTPPEDIAKAWAADNPSRTSAALRTRSDAGPQTPDMSSILRLAAGK